MIIQFELKDLMLVLLCALGITVALLIIPVLLNIKKVTGMVRATLVKNQESIKKSLKSLPGILENAEDISHNSKEITNQLKISVPVITKDVESVTLAAKNIVASYGDSFDRDAEEATGFMIYVPLIKEVLQIINHAFFSKR